MAGNYIFLFADGHIFGSIDVRARMLGDSNRHHTLMADAACCAQGGYHRQHGALFASFFTLRELAVQCDNALVGLVVPRIENASICSRSARQTAELQRASSPQPQRPARHLGGMNSNSQNPCIPLRPRLAYPPKSYVSFFCLHADLVHVRQLLPEHPCRQKQYRDAELIIVPHYVVAIEQLTAHPHLRENCL